MGAQSSPTQPIWKWPSFLVWWMDGIVGLLLFACESITHQRQNNSIVTLYWGDFNINLLLRPKHNMPLFYPFAAVTLHLRFHSVRNYLLIEQHQRRHLDILPHINRRSRSFVQINSSWHFVATTTPQRPLTLIYYEGNFINYVGDFCKWNST